MAEDLSCLSGQIEDREWRKFTCNSDGKTAIRTVGEIKLPDLNADNIKISNVNIPIASTEQSHLLTNNVKRILIRSRESYKLQIAFIATESGSNYLTIGRGVVLQLDGLNLVSTTLYFQSPNMGNVEIVEFY